MRIKIDSEFETVAHEFNAIVSDLASEKLPKDHPCYFVAVGQFV